MEQLQFIGVQPKSFIEEIAMRVNEIYKATAPEPQPKEKLLTRKETAEYLGISLVTLHTWSKNGTLKAYRIGNKVRYKESEVLASLSEINAKRG